MLLGCHCEQHQSYHACHRCCCRLGTASTRCQLLPCQSQLLLQRSLRAARLKLFLQQLLVLVLVLVLYAAVPVPC
jgi:hypothetical protein